jgi:hypothetical protein
LSETRSDWVRSKMAGMGSTCDESLHIRHPCSKRFADHMRATEVEDSLSFLAPVRADAVVDSPLVRSDND